VPTAALSASEAIVFPVLADRAPTLLAIDGPLLSSPEGPFVPVAGALSAVPFGITQIWWGLLMWRSAVGLSKAVCAE
jgi:hypothetical protein